MSTLTTLALVAVAVAGWQAARGIAALLRRHGDTLRRTAVLTCLAGAAVHAYPALLIAPAVLVGLAAAVALARTHPPGHTPDDTGADEEEAPEPA